MKSWWAPRWPGSRRGSSRETIRINTNHVFLMAWKTHHLLVPISSSKRNGKPQRILSRRGHPQGSRPQTKKSHCSCWVPGSILQEGAMWGPQSSLKSYLFPDSSSLLTSSWRQWHLGTDIFGSLRERQFNFAQCLSHSTNDLQVDMLCRLLNMWEGLQIMNYVFVILIFVQLRVFISFLLSSANIRGPRAIDT